MLIPGGSAGGGGREPDGRMTLPQRPGGQPPEEMLGRREFALAPWIALSVIGIGLAISEFLRERHGQVDWLIVGLALAVAAGTAVLAGIQDRPTGRRFRHAVWVYALGSGVVLATLAALAVYNRGVSSVYYAGTLPLAAYVGLVFPPRLRPWTLVALFIATVLVQVANPKTLLFDAAAMWALIVCCWFSGVLVNVGQARIARIARTLASYDRLSRTLNRRGFLRQLELAVRPDGSAHPDPVALLLVNVTGFRAANEAGDLAGDELLEWIGTTFPSALPANAELGRLGDDEFGVLLPGTTRAQAEAVAHSVRAFLQDRVEVTVGVATSETRRVAPADLFRVADAARVYCTRQHLGVHVLVAGSARVPGRRATLPAGLDEHPLSYAAVRKTGRVPRIVEQGALYNRLIRQALLGVAAAGVVIVAREWLSGDQGFYPDVVRYLGVPWILWNLALAGSTLRYSVVQSPRFELFMLVNSSAAIAIGVGCTALATGGLTAPIGAGLFVKVIFDTSMIPPRRAVMNSAILLGGWAVVALLSPPTTLWVVPFHLALFAASYALGSIGYRAGQQTAAYAKSLAVTDSLTLLPNRIGFREQAEVAFFRSVTETGQPFGLLAFHVTGFKAYNEANGHAAGDALLCEVAELLRSELPGHHVIGRTAAREFVAAAPLEGTLSAMRIAEDLRRAFSTTLGIEVAVGEATCPEDGATFERLLAVADERARARRTITAAHILHGRSPGSMSEIRRASS